MIISGQPEQSPRPKDYHEEAEYLDRMLSFKKQQRSGGRSSTSTQRGPPPIAPQPKTHLHRHPHPRPQQRREKSQLSANEWALQRRCMALQTEVREMSTFLGRVQDDTASSVAQLKKKLAARTAEAEKESSAVEALKQDLHLATVVSEKWRTVCEQQRAALRAAEEEKAAVDNGESFNRTHLMINLSTRN